MTMDIIWPYELAQAWDSEFGNYKHSGFCLRSDCSERWLHQWPGAHSQVLAILHFLTCILQGSSSHHSLTRCKGLTCRTRLLLHQLIPLRLSPGNCTAILLSQNSRNDAVTFSQTGPFSGRNSYNLLPLERHTHKEPRQIEAAPRSACGWVYHASKHCIQRP